MQSRIPKKALIIFKPGSEADARAFVQQQLQYRALHQQFYMLPLSPKNKSSQLLVEQLNALMKAENLTPANVDCYLIEKASKLSAQMKNHYSDSIKSWAASFRTHFVIITCNSASGEQRVNTLTPIRTHQRYSTGHGYSSSQIKQVSVHVKYLPQDITIYANPPYKYLLFRGMKSAFADISADLNYMTIIEKELIARQKKSDPILRHAEEDYQNPATIAERLGNLFHAYSHKGLFPRHRSHYDLAKNIAEDLYAIAPQEQDHTAWEVQDYLSLIDFHVSHEKKDINPQQTFQGITAEIHNMLFDQTLLQVGDELTDVWQKKCDQLDKLKAGLPKEAKQYADQVFDECKRLEKNGRPLIVLLRALDSTINIIKQPTAINYKNHCKIASEIGKHSWGRKLSGLLLCVLGATLGIAIGLTIYFTGGISLLAAPALLAGVALAATLIKVGLALMAGVSIASFIGAGICFFGKSPLQNAMEKLTPSTINHKQIS